VEFVYIVYSRPSLTSYEGATFRRVYASMDSAIKYVDKKNSATKRYYFWLAEPVTA